MIKLKTNKTRNHKTMFLFLKFESEFKRLNFMCLIILLLSFSNIFAAKELLQESYLQMFDVGLAHINGDDYYDIYTANHGYSETLLLSEKGMFSRISHELNEVMIGKSAAHEMNAKIPNFREGLNIFRTDDSLLFLLCQKCGREVKGKISIPKALLGEKATSVIHIENADVVQTEITERGDFDLIEFTLQENSLLVLKRKYVSVALDFEIEYKNIFIGAKQKVPDTSQFSLISRDNHSFAWTRLNNDQYADVFVGAGGLKGKIRQFEKSQILNDMLLVSSETDRYKDVYSSFGLQKNNCRTYSSMWIDVDSDNDLDLYIGCQNDKNQLFIQTENGLFIEQAEKFGLNFRHGSVFKWQDWNRDGYQDIVLIENNRLNLYLSELKDNEFKFKLIKTSQPLGKFLQAVNTQLVISDINNDLIFEVFVTTAQKQHYFVQDGEGFKKGRLGAIGLPIDNKGHLNIVDVNLDGLLDICIFEDGIYLQGDDGKFNKSEILKDSFTYKSVYHKFENDNSILWFRNYLWFDKENDGSWDVLEAGTFRNGTAEERKQSRQFNVMKYNFKKPYEGSKIYLHKSIERKNNWLQIELTGTEKNLDAIGSEVTVNAGKRVQYRFTYGNTDSFHSQGHYRHYFGLGDNDTAKVTVKWPNGKEFTLDKVKANQLLNINYQDISMPEFPL